MKTVNLTIDEETWRAARRLAAERDTSVSALVREALEQLTKTSERREEAQPGNTGDDRFLWRSSWCDAIPGGEECPPLR